MKTQHRTLYLAIAAVLCLGGCAGMESKPMAAGTQVDNDAYIAKVERTARNRGVSVRWVNPPQKRTVAQQ
jgi:glutamine synthetase